ncbi:MAG TPA: cytochrome c biogenesis protein CcsA [Acidimicrobiia bacterium]|nr:cytochrome c biogenesis protein CcsA [Acidimicrobiia bacterium]
MTAGVIGPVAIWAAIAFGAIALVSGRRWALVGSAVSAAAAVMVLTVALLASDFSLAYVAETTSRATPWPYRLAALWGGMGGSMLFYTAMVSVVGASAVRRTVPIRAVSAVVLGLLLITVFLANPFEVTPIPAVDGLGLLAILQHPAMVYHPPILYLGLTVLVVPFAQTVGFVVAKGRRDPWMAGARRWLYGSWALLTLGMAAGANWAYVELGWGGFWAWDPVENTALMPWLAITVFLHASRLEEATGRLRRWNVLFAALPFALTILGVYLTRSGATGSIHSFAEDPVVGRVLIVAAAVVALLAVVGSLRSSQGEPWGRVRLDRSGWLGLNAAMLAIVLVFVTAGSAYPAFVSVFLDRTVTVDSRYYVVTILPIAVVIASTLYLAFGRNRLAFITVAGLTAAATALVADLRPGVILLVPAAASFLLLAPELWRRRRVDRILVSRLAHLGMALLLVGVAGSSLGGDFTGSMRPGEEVTVAGREVALVSVDTGQADRFDFVRADFTVDGAPVSPEIRAYEDQAVPVAEPALRSGLTEDVIVAVSLLFPDGETVQVSVFVRPLVTLVWVGAIAMGLAGLLALFSRAVTAVEPHRSATARPRPG